MDFMATLHFSYARLAFLLAHSAQVHQLAPLALLASIYTEAPAWPTVQAATSRTIPFRAMSARFARTTALLVQESTPVLLVCLLVFSSVESAALPVPQLPPTTSLTIVSTVLMLFLAASLATHPH